MYKEIETLLALSKEGDVKSKEQLLFKLKPLLIGSIRRYYNRIDLYDDLIQEGYETILTAIDDYDPKKGVYFLGYIKAMLKYHYLNKHREKQHLSLNEPVDCNGTEIIDLIEGDEKDPADRIIDMEENQVLLDSINCLTKRQRETIVYFYINGYSIDKIANKLGISYRTVVNTKTVGINKLRNTIVK